MGGAIPEGFRRRPRSFCGAAPACSFFPILVFLLTSFLQGRGKADRSGIFLSSGARISRGRIILATGRHLSIPWLSDNFVVQPPLFFSFFAAKPRVNADPPVISPLHTLPVFPRVPQGHQPPDDTNHQGIPTTTTAATTTGHVLPRYQGRRRVSSPERAAFIPGPTWDHEINTHVTPPTTRWTPSTLCLLREGFAFPSKSSLAFPGDENLHYDIISGPRGRHRHRSSALAARERTIGIHRFPATWTRRTSHVSGAPPFSQSQRVCVKFRGTKQNHTPPSFLFPNSVNCPVVTGRPRSRSGASSFHFDFPWGVRLSLGPQNQRVCFFIFLFLLIFSEFHRTASSQSVSHPSRGLHSTPVVA